MRKPKFLRFFGERKILKQKLSGLQIKYKDQSDRIRELENKIRNAESQAISKKLEAKRIEDKKENPFYSDCYEVVFDKKGNFKSMTYNDKPLHGVQYVSIETDGKTQQPLIYIEALGNINVLTEEE